MEKKELFSNFYDYIISNIIPDFTDKQCEIFEIYFDELIEWNKKINLISFKTENDLIYRHFCDSLYSVKAIKKVLPSGRLKAADIGTDSGMPGIPVKIALPETDMTLVESITKKVRFS